MILLILSTFLAIMAIVGYGRIFQKAFFPDKVNISIGLVGIFGLFF